jgi:uncharacterized membrane protein YhaH (DUF805 family)
MKGNVIGFDPDTNTGAVSGHDGNRYDFTTMDWHGRGQPRHGDVVDFQADGRRAHDIYLIEPEYIPPSLGEFLFSPSGRISRSQYWLKFALPVAAVQLVFVAIIGALILSDSLEVAGIIYILYAIFLIAMVWPSLAILIKRSHDRDWPWPFILLLLVPLVQFWPLVEIWFLRGTIGGNRFGPDPVPHA